MYNSGGAFAGEAAFTYNAATNVLSAPNIVTVDIDVQTITSTSLITAASLTVTTNAGVTGNLTVNGNTTLGDANTDTVSFTGRVNTDFVPLTDDTYDLGTPALKWDNAYIDNLLAGGLTYPTTDGTAGQFLTTNGSGVLTFATSTGAPGGSDTQVQFKNGSNFAGDAGLTYNSGTDTLTTVKVAATDVTTVRPQHKRQCFTWRCGWWSE